MRLCALTASFVLAAQAGAKKDELTVKTTSGTYTGLVNSTAPDVNQWLGIPYGLPPLGSRRFMPPSRAPNYGAADAKAYKPICFQDNGSKTGVYWELPAKKKLPVIIWVCGGGFKEGGGHALYQVPDQWIQRTQTHLVVTFNYRLNIFGFPGSSAASKNAGLMDIRLAVEWPKTTLTDSGKGDPRRMVLYGQSAGAVAALTYGYAYPQQPIVGGIIASSSGTSATYPTNSSNFHNVAQVAGCANLTATEELACMQNIDALELQQKVVAANPDPTRGLFRPLADNITVFANMTDRLEKGLVAKLPVIAGFTYNEPAAFLLFDPDATAAPNATTPGADGLACGVKREAARRIAYGLTTYRYLYSGNFTNITPRYWLGGMHSSDIPLVFGTHHQYRGNSTELEWQTSFAMQSFWVSFAANPSADPRNHVGQVWPKFTGTDGDIIVFGNATVPSASYAAPVAIADKYSGAC
ncbi:hypothetical protein OQA88_1174 [Cercophora sp. LCS_1]